MTPMPPSPSEESIPPPRQSPNVGNLTKDTTESDLWAFDDDAELASGNTIEKSSKATPHFLPIPRESDKMKMRQPKETVGTKFGGNMDRAKAHVTKPFPVARAGSAAEPTRPISDFEDLDTWDEPVPSLVEITGNPEAGAVPVTPQHTHAAEVVPPPSPGIDEQDEFSPPARENTRKGLRALRCLSRASDATGFFRIDGIGFRTGQADPPDLKLPRCLP